MSVSHFFRERGSRPFPWIKKFKPVVSQIVNDHQCHGDINFILCTNETIKSINNEFRKQNKVTDVISMEWNTKDILGEIYIAEAQVKKQANRYQISYYRELLRMIIHGTLHLAGFDHIKAKDRKLMRSQEDYYHAIALGKKP